MRTQEEARTGPLGGGKEVVCPCALSSTRGCWGATWTSSHSPVSRSPALASRRRALSSTSKRIWTFGVEDNNGSILTSVGPVASSTRVSHGPLRVQPEPRRNEMETDFRAAPTLGCVPNARPAALTKPPLSPGVLAETISPLFFSPTPSGTRPTCPGGECGYD